jgi:hypothetical protein
MAIRPAELLAANTPDASDPSWKSLYSVAGVAALLASLLFLSDLVVLMTAGEFPASARAWFTLFEDNRVPGLLQLFFSDLIGVALVAPLVLALYAVLRRANAGYAALAVVLAVLGIATLFATNPNYTLIHLSLQIGQAPAPAEADALVAAGEAVFAAGTAGTGPLMAALALEGSLLLLSAIMLRSPAFGKGIAYLGIAAHGLDLARTVVSLLLIPLLGEETALAISTPLLAVGGTLQLIWYPLVGWKLIRLGRAPRLGTSALASGTPASPAA